MTQKRTHSALESVANLAVGYALAMAVQAIVFPIVLGVQATTTQHAGIALIFSVVSLARSYTLRRLFNRFL